MLLKNIEDIVSIMVKSPEMRTDVPFLGLNAPGWRKREQKCNGHATNIA